MEVYCLFHPSQNRYFVTTIIGKTRVVIVLKPTSWQIRLDIRHLKARKYNMAIVRQCRGQEMGCGRRPRQEGDMIETRQRQEGDKI